MKCGIQLWHLDRFRKIRYLQADDMQIWSIISFLKLEQREIRSFTILSRTTKGGARVLVMYPCTQHMLQSGKNGKDWQICPHPIFFLIIHAIAMKIGMDMLNHLNFWFLQEKISGNVRVGCFWCWRQQKWWFWGIFTSCFAWLTKKGLKIFLTWMILKRVYEVPNEVENLLRSLFFGFPDFSEIHRQANFLSIGRV